MIENRFHNLSFQTLRNCTAETRASPFQDVASVPEDLPGDQPWGTPEHHRRVPLGSFSTDTITGATTAQTAPAPE